MTPHTPRTPKPSEVNPQHLEALLIVANRARRFIKFSFLNTPETIIQREIASLGDSIDKAIECGALPENVNHLDPCPYCGNAGQERCG